MECKFGQSRFLEGQGEKELGLGRSRYFCVFISILGLSLFKQEGIEDLKRAKVRKLNVTPSLIIYDSGKNPNLM